MVSVNKMNAMRTAALRMFNELFAEVFEAPKAAKAVKRTAKAVTVGTAANLAVLRKATKGTGTTAKAELEDGTRVRVVNGRVHKLDKPCSVAGCKHTAGRNSRSRYCKTHRTELRETYRTLHTTGTTAKVKATAKAKAAKVETGISQRDLNAIAAKVQSILSVN